MGWWKVQGTEHTIGDRPLDLLGDAVALVVEDYEKALKRRPTHAEWEALLEAVLGTQVSLTMEPRLSPSGETSDRRTDVNTRTP